MSDERLCVTCPVIHAHGKPRLVHTPQCCGICRQSLARTLGDIPELCVRLASLGFVVRSDRDPVSRLLPSGPIAGRTSAPKVSGSRERGVPERFDLLAPARVPNPHRDEDGLSTAHPDDQVGTASVATTLDQWVRDWISYPFCRSTFLPEPDVTSLAVWLGLWLDPACTHHPAIDEFADELRDIHLVLRRANGLTEPVPELCLGVPCRRCDLRALYKIPGSEYVECDNCGLLFTDAEYRRWVRLVAAAA